MPSTAPGTIPTSGRRGERGPARSGWTAEVDLPASEAPALGRAHEPIDVAADEFHQGVRGTLAPHEHEVRHRPADVTLNVDDRIHARVEAPALGSLEAADHCHDCRRTDRGLAAQR